ncbi:hypothetical protein HYD96_02680 [Mycoplasmopsis bovis]|nr:hypothetical protein [Mycoplasmopsis bovis]QQH34705.1 hypothetical protein HYD96_02680 [Mycoplasmopsis bovis]
MKKTWSLRIKKQKEQKNQEWETLKILLGRGKMKCRENTFERGQNWKSGIHIKPKKFRFNCWQEIRYDNIKKDNIPKILKSTGRSIFNQRIH